MKACLVCPDGVQSGVRGVLEPDSTIHCTSHICLEESIWLQAVERFRLRGTGSLRPTALATVINRCSGVPPGRCRQLRKARPIVQETPGWRSTVSQSEIGPDEPAAWSSAIQCTRRMHAGDDSGCIIVLHLSALGSSVRWNGV